MIYFAVTDDMSMVKIGSSASPKERIQHLRSPNGDPVKLYKIIPSSFPEFRVPGRCREWFRLSADQLSDLPDTRIESNLQAVGRIIEAERTKLRHGGLNIVRAGFRGYASLPPPTGPDGQIAKPWWAELGFTDTPPLADAESRYRELVKTAHPDRDGDPAKFNAITDAIRNARIELKAAT